MSKPKPSTADSAHTPTSPRSERRTGANAPAESIKPIRHDETRDKRIPLRGTQASDLAALKMYPQIGTSVRIDVDKIPRMERKDFHQFLIDHGLHGAVGVVQGTEVRAGVYGLIVETGSNRVWVDARCCYEDALPPQPPMMQDESRLSPEKMRKQKSGSYNLT